MKVRVEGQPVTFRACTNAVVLDDDRESQLPGDREPYVRNVQCTPLGFHRVCKRRSHCLQNGGRVIAIFVYLKHCVCVPTTSCLSPSPYLPCISAFTQEAATHDGTKSYFVHAQHTHHTHTLSSCMLPAIFVYSFSVC